MHVFEFILIIVALGTFGTMFQSWLKHQREKPELDSDESDDRIDALEKRVAVLERIATDKGQSLKDEIDNL